VEGRAVVIGREAFLSDWSQRLGDLAGPKGEAEAQGRTPVVIGWDGAVRGVLVVADTIKESSAEAVRQIRELGLRPVLLTGDNDRAARTVAAAVGIDEVHA